MVIQSAGIKNNVKNERIQYLDAWRCIAVTLVIISHVVQHSSGWYREHLPWLLVGRMPTLGAFGVQIFFCISGFVICRGLIAEQSKTGSISMRAFYVRRFLRIGPPLILYMGGLGIMTWLGYINVTSKQFALASAFACNFDLGKCG